MANKKSNVTISLKDQVTARLKKIEKGFGKLTKRLTQIAAVGVGVAAFFGARFFAGAIRSSAQFEEQLSKVGAVARANEEQMDRLRKAADLAGTRTRFTATEAAQGLEELARAGLNADEAIQTLNPSLQVAQGNAIEVADAAQLVTTTLNQFGKEAGFASRAADILTRGTQTSAQNIEDLANALEFAGPQARQMGLSLEETVAIIGKLADQGFRGQKGGTALRNALIELQNPASNFRKELGALNIHSTDFVEVLEGLAARGGDSRDALLSLGKRAGPAISALVAGGVDELGDLIQILREAEGTAEQTAAAMDDNLPGAMKGLASAFDAVRRRLVDPLLEPIKREIQDITQRLRDFAASDAINQVGDKLKEVFGQAVEAVRGFLSEFTLEEVIEKVKGFLSATATVFRTFVENSKAAASGARKVWNGFGLVFDSIAASVKGAAAGFIQLLIVNEKWAKSMLEAEKRAKALFGLDTSKLEARIREYEIRIGGLQAAQDAMFASTRESIEGAKENWAQLTGEVDAAKDKIKDTAPALDAAGKAAEGAADSADGLSDSLDDVGDAAERAGREGADGLQAVADGAEEAEETVQTLQEKVQELGGNIREELEKDAEAARRAFEQVLDSQSATLEQKRAAFLSYAAAAIAANNGVISSELQQQAALLGTTERLEKLRQKVVEVKNLQRQGTDELRAGIQQVTQETEESGRKFGEVSERWRQEARSIGSFLGDIVNGWKSLNASAARHMDAVLLKLGRTVRTTAGYFQALAKETRQLGAIQAEQNETLARIEERYRATGNALEFVRHASSFLQQELILLDQSRLDQLRAQIDSARQAMDQFRSSTVSALQEATRELLQLQGNELEVLRLDAATKIQELKAQLAQAPDRTSRRNLQDAIRLQEKILRIKEEQLRANQAQTAEAEKQRAISTPPASQATAAPTPQPSAPLPTAFAGPAPGPDPFTGIGGGRTVTIRLVAPDGLSADLTAGDEAIAERVVEILRQLGAVDAGGGI